MSKKFGLIIGFLAAGALGVCLGLAVGLDLESGPFSGVGSGSSDGSGSGSGVETSEEGSGETSGGSGAGIETDADYEYSADSNAEIKLDADGGIILQNLRADNYDEAPLLNGGMVQFLKNEGSDSQQLSAVFMSSDGRVIVVDGGVREDVDHLLKTIADCGGHVDAWLITHPQNDHAGALAEILERASVDEATGETLIEYSGAGIENTGTSADNIGAGADNAADATDTQGTSNTADTSTTITISDYYYTLLDQQWYDTYDSDEAGTAWVLRNALEKVPEDKKHASLSAGSRVTLSENHLSFKIINDALQIPGTFAGNSAGIMYDIDIEGKHFLMLGDMSEEGGSRIMEDGLLDDVPVEYVQMAHHGQAGVSNEFYEALSPKYCIWPANYYIFYPLRSERGQRELATEETKRCIASMGEDVRANYVTLDKDVVIR